MEWTLYSFRYFFFIFYFQETYVDLQQVNLLSFVAEEDIGFQYLRASVENAIFIVQDDPDYLYFDPLLLVNCK